MSKSYEKKSGNLTRRKFIQTTVFTGAAISVPWLWTSQKAVAAGVLAGTIADPRFSAPVIDPKAIPKFVTEMPVPGAKWGIIDLQTSTSATIQVSQLTLQVLPTGYPTTAVWAYREQDAFGDEIKYDGSFLGPTIITTSLLAGGTPLEITYDYKKVSPDMHILKTGIPAIAGAETVIDKHVHGTDMSEPEVRFIAHLHGGKNIDEDSDGYSEAWVTPGGETDTDSPVDNQAMLTYKNDQGGTLAWYHDHALGITKYNVYAGLAAAYIIRGKEEQPDGILEAVGLMQLPEIPMVIQDRMFYPDGRLAYPDMPWVAPANAGAVKPWPGGPSTLPEYFGDVMLVNGVTWPRISVPAGQVRLRLINGCNSRFLDMFLSSNGQSAKNGLSFTVIGSEGGFLNTAVISPTLLMANAERYDVILDFTGQGGRSFTLRNKGARKPFPDGKLPNPQLDGVVAQFVVDPLLQPLPALVAPLPLQLRDELIEPLTPDAGPIRVLLTEGMDEFGRIQPMLGKVTETVAGAPIYTGTSQRWDDPVTENPKVGETLVWEIFNTTVDSHPVHLHAVLFQIVDRQAITFNKYAPTPTSTVTVNNIQLAGAVKPPQPLETGSEMDTVICYPGEVTRIIATFGIAGLFQWHCHILEHEDHEMMRPYRIG